MTMGLAKTVRCQWPVACRTPRAKRPFQPASDELAPAVGRRPPRWMDLIAPSVAPCLVPSVHLSFKVLKASSPRKIEITQNLTMILGSAHPFISK